MDDAKSAAVSAQLSTEVIGAAQLRDTLRASDLACRTAGEVVRNARAAIATSEQRIRTAQRATQALRSAWTYRAQLRAKLNEGGEGPTLANAEPEAAADYR